MSKKLDCRGLACPAPVLQTKNLIEQQNPTVVEVLVDNEAAKQNVTRFLESQSFQVSLGEDPDGFHVIGQRERYAAPEPAASESPEPAEKKIMVMVASDGIGRGDDELGKKLMVSFLTTLQEMEHELWRLVFVNNGVKLTIAGSEVLPVLEKLEDKGVYILVCGTCLTHFGLMDQKQVGETTNMLDIVTAMQLADKVINI